ncbi:sodium:proton antiporter [Lactobacillus taiwanensis]|uniref:cation:proton antiporter n=1 Tax=Lactobacillus taiwanensis TaxID=508451 RepID=UPI00214BB9BF|nr:sodium:proton antiporter [Lactobacillus taiwanensis]MCR1903751.1 sodium:proton antiporter [Lactobacillus taiwanensis]
MELMISSFTLAIAAAISIIIAQAIDKVSANYISMIIGIIIGLVPFLNYQIASFNPEIFMELIVAPLLFFEGQKTKIHNIGRRIKEIIGLTVIMVLLALIVSGFSIHLLAGISLPLAFIIGSISTPTDATASDAVTNGLRMPRRVTASLKAESLFNDASGIILLNMSLLWFANGYINYSQTIQEFLISSVGGSILGVAVAWIIIIFRQSLIRSRFNSLNAQNLIYILTPLALYALAEHLHVSGIIAVVVAGLLHNAESQQSLLINSRQIHMGRDLENLISDIFNSMVFIILGLMMVRISRNKLFNSDLVKWITVGIIVYLANLLVRYTYARLVIHYNRRESIVFSLGGIHGAVTLALALTISARFLGTQSYNLVIMSEAILIILSMLVPTIIFQFILPHEVSDEEAHIVVDKVRNEMVKRALISVHRIYLPQRVKRHVIYTLLNQKRVVKTREYMAVLLKTIDQPNLTKSEQYLQRLAFFRAFAVEREYLEMIGQKESKYRTYILSLYNDVLLAESLIIEPEDE